jgi:hypothetical protein
MLLRLVLVIVIATALAGAAFAVVLRVEQDGSGDYLKIQDAVNVAASGDTILIGPGRYDDLQPRGVNSVVCVAYWEDSRNLTFIGESSDEVIVGPTTYVPEGTGPQGIHQHEPADVVIRNLTFANLRVAIVAGRGTAVIEGAFFSTGETGVFIQDAASCGVRNCTFTDFPLSQGGAVTVFRASYAEILECEFVDAGIYFGGTTDGLVRGCSAHGDRFLQSYQSNILVDKCTANCDRAYYCVEATDSDALHIQDSVISVSGGSGNIASLRSQSNVVIERSVIDGSALQASFRASFSGSMLVQACDVQGTPGVPLIVSTYDYPEGNSATIDMGGNYWSEHSNAAALDSLIYDGNDDPNIHVIVNYEPIRTESMPAEKKSLGGIKALFLGR